MAKGICTAREECTNAAKYANGFCGTCYTRLARHGSVNGKSLSKETLPVAPLARFIERNGLIAAPFHSVLTEKSGVLSVAKADELACKVLRVHPVSVWSDWFERAANAA